jgi:small subunit ribosomal protein S17e
LGKIRTVEVKNVAKDMLNKHHDQFGIDFEANKRLLVDLAPGIQKTTRNKVAGYISRLRRIELKTEGV